MRRHAALQSQPEAAGPPLAKHDDRLGTAPVVSLARKAAARLVVEVDGAQHFETSQATRDATRSVYLQTQGLRVLRFTNREVLKELDAAVAAIFTTLPPDKKSS